MRSNAREIRFLELEIASSTRSESAKYGEMVSDRQIDAQVFRHPTCFLLWIRGGGIKCGIMIILVYLREIWKHYSFLRGDVSVPYPLSFESELRDASRLVDPVQISRSMTISAASIFALCVSLGPYLAAGLAQQHQILQARIFSAEKMLHTFQFLLHNTCAL